MPLFSIATLCPFALLACAAVWGNPFGWLALGYITALIFVLDAWVPRALHNAPPEAEFPGSDRLLRVIGYAHFATLGLAVWAVAAHPTLGLAERGVVALSAALAMGQISHPVAHELIHKPARAARLMGRLIYTSLLFGHHASAHLRVHHVHVGSKADPNSARWGEGVYRFMWRAWPGGFIAGLRAENKMRRGAQGIDISHPYVLYVGGAAALLLSAALVTGGAGLAALVFIALYAQLQILLSDYVQHYGLRRTPRADGKLEPVGVQHSWNAPHWASSAMTLHAPRHSDHHVTPARAYPALQLDPDTMPVLPHSLPVMAVLALIPPLWRRIMDPLCAKWAARENQPAA
ncbi:MAG: alkane 1-monooxygenase [Roseovarius sp.]